MLVENENVTGGGVYALHLMEFPMNFKSIFEQKAREVSSEGQQVIVCISTFMCDQWTDLSARHCSIE